ncbi:OTU domain-containing protein 4 isoform X2 [Micropterus dolomieu]|uniref:OTU domain-containing protein 4 isoform X2 n=1 Tax=Micropterus dolomieu TaxID=147949 RepID=UPI001E8D1C1E|nr:OTU domain-containing protein 4 isoform X2 [Micropterus dolomieu]
MDGGGSMQSNEERGAEKLMDDYLKSIGLHRKKIAKDGSCLFRAVAEQVLHCQSLHTEVRAKCVEFLKQNRESYEAFIEGDFEDYLYKLQDPQQWVGEVEINALAVMYKRDFQIFQEPCKPPVNITDNNFKDKVRLCFLNGNHYDSVYPVSHIKSAALCQSILYELLYEDVFNVDRSFLGLCQRPARPSDLLSDDNMPACGSSDESDFDTGEPLWVENGTNTTAPRHRGRGRGRQLPERVRRSLNPTLFRNIEYDVWHKTKRAQQKMDYRIAAGMQFTVGDRCQVRLDSGGRSYNATIKEVPPNNGPVTVHIEELGRRQVPLWSLRASKDENSWSTVVNRDKRLSNGHGEWEERGKGRGRGKQVPASSSVSPTTAPGPSGRVHKQHSWPPQATVEEQGGVKANRKSVSSVDSAFGISEKERLAREEEERKGVLLEIQLRDEHSFPALGAQSVMQGEVGRKKGGEKRRSQRNKTGAAEDIRAPSPSAGERPKSSTPPLAAAAAATTNTTTPTNPTLHASKPSAAPSANSNPVWLSSIKAAASSLPPACGAPAAKTNTPSYAVASATPSSPAAAATPNTKASVTGGAVPHSVSPFPFLTPSLPAASSTTASHVLPSSSLPPSSSSQHGTSTSSSLPPKSSASPPASSLPPLTFIAPIAPSPAAAQGFLSTSSLPRSSPPVSSLPHSPSPPTFSSSSTPIHQAAQVHEAPKVSAQTPNCLPNIGPQTFQSQASLPPIHPQVSLPQNHGQISVSQTQTHTSLTQSDNQTLPPLPQNQILMPQMQTEAQATLPQSCPPHLQHQPQSHTEVDSLPQTQIQPSVLQTSLPQSQASVSHLPPHSQAQYLSQSQCEVAQVQSSHPAPGASYPHASIPVSASVQPQQSATHPHLHVQPAQPPHPSQVPHPSHTLSASPTNPSLQSQTPNTQNQTEVPLTPTQPQPESPAHVPSQQAHLPHPPHHPQSAHPPPPHQSIPGAVPLQQLSQLYQDPLYPGFPQGEKGDVAPNPPYSSSKSGDDLPQDINILRFFFNLGVKAYSMPLYPPYIYLLPLQQAHTVHPKLPSRSPSPTPPYPPSNPPTRHQEAYQHPHYPPTSASMAPQYDHQAPLTEPPHPSDPSFSQAGYPVTQPPPHRMSLSWQQHQMPQHRSPSYPVGYPASNQPYSVPQPLSQGYHPGQSPGHTLYPQSVPPYPPSSLGYHSSSTPEEIQVSQAPMEHRQPANGDTMPGQGPGRVPGPLESPAANMANANNRTAMIPGFAALKKEQGESLSGTVLLVDPPLNNNPILVSNHSIKDVSASMTSMKPGSTPGSPLPYDLISKTAVSGDANPSRGYRNHRKPMNPPNQYVPLGAPEPSQVSYLSPVGMAEPLLSVGCSTEDDWEEPMGFKRPALNPRGMRRSHRGAGAGGRGRGGYDQGRGANRRRHGGEPGAGLNYVQFNRGRGREREY